MTLAVKTITTPDLGGAAEVTVIEVLVKPGDHLDANAAIVTLESDKATMEIPTADAGVVKEVKVKVGDHVATGSVLITLEVAADATAKTDKPVKPAESSASSVEVAKPAPTEQTKPSTPAEPASKGSSQVNLPATPVLT